MFIFNVVVKKLDLEKTMKFSVTINRDEDGMWIVECPAIPGCVSQGKTKDEALVNIKDAIQLCLQVRAEHGLPLTIGPSSTSVLAGEYCVQHISHINLKMSKYVNINKPILLNTVIGTDNMIIPYTSHNAIPVNCNSKNT